MNLIFGLTEPGQGYQPKMTFVFHSYYIGGKKRYLKVQYIPEKVKPRTGYCVTCILSFVAPTVDRIIVHMLHGAILYIYFFILYIMYL